MQFFNNAALVALLATAGAYAATGPAAPPVNHNAVALECFKKTPTDQDAIKKCLNDIDVTLVKLLGTEDITEALINQKIPPPKVDKKEEKGYLSVITDNPGYTTMAVCAVVGLSVVGYFLLKKNDTVDEL